VIEIDREKNPLCYEDVTTVRQL